MNEKLQYAEMLDIPITSTVNVIPAKKRVKRKKKVDIEEVKETLIEKVNSIEPEFEPINEPAKEKIENLDQGEVVCQTETEEEQLSSVKVVKEKKKSRFNVIGLQLCIIGVLVAGIFLTNAFVPNSGLNRIFADAFGSGEAQTVDERVYTDFAPELIESGVFTLEDGVISIGGKTSVYSPVNGKVVSVIKGDDGLYTIEVEHSKNFSTIFSGLDHAYRVAGEQALKNVPIGYSSSGNAKMTFYGTDNAKIVNYTIAENTVIWAV